MTACCRVFILYAYHLSLLQIKFNREENKKEHRNTRHYFSGHHWFFVFFTWDDTPEREPYIEGYIVEAGFMRQLVVHGITKEQAADLSLEDAGVNEFSSYPFILRIFGKS